MSVMKYERHVIQRAPYTWSLWSYRATMYSSRCVQCYRPLNAAAILSAKSHRFQTSPVHQISTFAIAATLIASRCENQSVIPYEM